MFEEIATFHPQRMGITLSLPRDEDSLARRLEMEFAATMMVSGFVDNAPVAYRLNKGQWQWSYDGRIALYHLTFHYIWSDDNDHRMLLQATLDKPGIWSVLNSVSDGKN